MLSLSLVDDSDMDWCGCGFRFSVVVDRVGLFLVLMCEISGSDGFSWISFSGFASKLDGFVRFGCFVKI